MVAKSVAKSRNESHGMQLEARYGTDERHHDGGGWVPMEKAPGRNKIHSVSSMEISENIKQYRSGKRIWKEEQLQFEFKTEDQKPEKNKAPKSWTGEQMKIKL